MVAGEVNARLTAVHRVATSMWLFQCSCGKQKVLSVKNVRSGSTRSCGCLNAEHARRIAAIGRFKHGDAKVGAVARLHTIWRGMLKRCNKSSNSKESEWYAKRGIEVCDEWKDYVAFKSWAMQNGYQDHLSIDRIDVNSGYSPANCRWSDMKTQSRNRTTSRFLEVNGSKKTIAEWAEIMGVRQGAITLRLQRGWSDADAVLLPIKQHKKWANQSLNDHWLFN